MTSDLTVYRGGRRTFSVTFPSITEPGYTVLFTVKLRPTLDEVDQGALIKLSAPLVNGSATFELTATETTLGPGAYVWDFCLVDPVGGRLPFMEPARFVVLATVTNRSE